MSDLVEHFEFNSNCSGAIHSIVPHGSLFVVCYRRREVARKVKGGSEGGGGGDGDEAYHQNNEERRKGRSGKGYR